MFMMKNYFKKFMMKNNMKGIKNKMGDKMEYTSHYNRKLIGNFYDFDEQFNDNWLDRYLEED